MYNQSRFNIYINLYLIFHIFLFTFTICTFRDIKKISDNKDYLVILDSGFFIYNFEKTKCKKFIYSPNRLLNRMITIIILLYQRMKLVIQMK